jgi:CRP/FNR family cyclic AMP-dependent transcriptional regulator
MTDLNQRVDLLRNVGLFSSCTDDELSRIAGLTEARTADAGELLCTEGAPGDDFFVVVEGTAEVSVGGDKVGDLDAGSFFGEMALIDGGERAATIKAATPMSLLVLSRNDFNTMLSSAMPHIVPKLMQVMGERIRVLAAHSGTMLPY